MIERHGELQQTNLRIYNKKLFSYVFLHFISKLGVIIPNDDLYLNYQS
jgi:hypothetical protein